MASFTFFLSLSRGRVDGGVTGVVGAVLEGAIVNI